MSREGTPKRMLGSEDEEEASPRPDKRARRGPASHASELQNGSSGDETVAQPEYQPGAIRRVKLQNFVTYSSVEFFPGSSLNMVIGPNGTGKSTLVCAICIGLGYDPKFLGRAKDVSEFVKHGADEAFIEIELQKPEKISNHPVVRCNIKRDGNKAMYTINKKPFSAKQVKARVGKLGVQIDNLCQFLPQDRVVEFAGMTPVELLKSTQRAVASQQMLDWHEKLKEYRKTQRGLQQGKKIHDDELASLEAQHRRQEADVQRIRERQDVRDEVKKLEQLKPFVEYEQKLNAAREEKRKSDRLARELQELKDAVEPALYKVAEKETYKNAVKTALQNRKGVLDSRFEHVQEHEVAYKESESKLNSHSDRQKQARNDIKSANIEANKARAEIRALQAKVGMPKPVSDEKMESVFEKIRQIGREERENSAAYDQLEEESSNLKRQIREREARLVQQEARLRNLNSKTGKQMEKLRKINSDTARAWTWVQSNQQLFEKQVFGPPMLECTVKNAQDVDVVEGLIPRGEMLVLTCQTKSDFILLQKKLREQGLSRVNQRHINSELDRFKPPISQRDLQKYGLDDWVIDRISGPEPVLASLCEGAKIHLTGFASQELNERQFQAISASSVSQWVSPGGSYRVSRRREYGPSAVSTSTRAIRKAQYWSDEPVDSNLYQQVERNIAELHDEMKELQGQIRELNGNRRRSLEMKRADLKTDMVAAKEEQRQCQAALTEYTALPVKLERAEIKLKSKADELQRAKDKLSDIEKEHDTLLVEKGETVVRLADAVEESRIALEGLQEAEIMLLEATSDHQVLLERNSLITAQLEEKKQEHERATRATEELRRELKQLGARLKSQLDKAGEGIKEYIKQKKSQFQSPADLEAEIESLKARLSLLQGDDGGRTLRMYEERAAKIEELCQKTKDFAVALEEVTARVNSVRQRWEPRLEKLVKQISRSFEYNMKQINCAGEVDIFKDEDDFDRWAIQIKVKFRENEPLSQLDSHRQSGGERAVSTIFYLMSLQTLTRSPFRVVDEINQGMDPRNERLVHARMVSIATGKDDMPVQQISLPRRRRDDDDDDEEEEEEDEDQDQTQNGGAPNEKSDENANEEEEEEDEEDIGEDVDSMGRQSSSQYFLITPKLLPDLRYERGMRVLCIGSGEHLPPASKGLVDFERALEVRGGLTAAAAG